MWNRVYIQLSADGLSSSSNGEKELRGSTNVAIERSACYASSGGDTPFGFEAIVVSMDMLRLFEEEYAKTPPPGSAMLTSVFAA